MQQLFRRLDSYATELFQTSLVRVDSLDPLLCLRISAPQRTLERCQVRVKLDNT